MKLSSDRCGSNYRNCVYISSYGIVVVGTIFPSDSELTNLI